MGLMTSNTASLSPEYVNKVFSKELLSHAKQKLVMDQFGQQKSLPKNMGSKTIRFFRRDVGAASNVQTLSEGVPISTFREITLTAVDATLAQFGEAIKTSDVLGWTDIFDTIDNGISAMGEDIALHTDFAITTEVVPNISAANKRYSGGAANFNALVALTNAQGAMTIQDLLGAMTQLELQRAPLAKGGEYVAIVPPQLAYDMMLDAKFVTAGEYGTHKGLFNGEIGRWYNIRVITHTQPWREANSNGTEGTFASTGPIFSTLVTGQEAWGVPTLAGQSPFSPRVIVCANADKSDPANQFATAAYKWFYVVKTLNDTYSVVVRSKTTFA